MINPQEDLNDFIAKLDEFVQRNCPSWITPNSYHMGIMPGHNLDLLQISFDFRIDRTSLLMSDTPQVLKDPSKAELTILRSEA